MLQQNAAAWLRERWQEKEEIFPYNYLITVSAECLPFAEAFSLATEINAANNNRFFESMAAFRNEAVLDWIEKNIELPAALWSKVAAYSNLTWDVAAKWIDKGRPLSLVAIKVIAEMSNVPEDHSVRLYKPAAIDEMSQKL